MCFFFFFAVADLHLLVSKRSRCKTSWSFEQLRNLCAVISVYKKFELYCTLKTTRQLSVPSLHSVAPILESVHFFVGKPLSFSRPVMIAVIMGKKGRGLPCLLPSPVEHFKDSSFKLYRPPSLPLLSLTWRSWALSLCLVTFFIYFFPQIPPPSQPALPAGLPTSPAESLFWMVFEHKVQVVQDLN